MTRVDFTLASCQGHQDVFFPIGANESEDQARESANQCLPFCKRCPIREECFNYDIEIYEQSGELNEAIMGGATQHQRMWLIHNEEAALEVARECLIANVKTTELSEYYEKYGPSNIEAGLTGDAVSQQYGVSMKTYKRWQKERKNPEDNWTPWRKKIEKELKSGDWVPQIAITDIVIKAIGKEGLTKIMNTRNGGRKNLRGIARDKADKVMNSGVKSGRFLKRKNTQTGKVEYRRSSIAI